VFVKKAYAFFGCASARVRLHAFLRSTYAPDITMIAPRDSARAGHACAWDSPSRDPLVRPPGRQALSRALPRPTRACAALALESDANDQLEDERNASTPRFRVHTRVAATAAHAAAAARVCGDAFAYETHALERKWNVWSGEKDSGGIDGLQDAFDEVVHWIGRALDESYAESITKELTHLTMHQIEERLRSSEARRRMNRAGAKGTTDRELIRLKQKGQCLTLISRLDEPRWIGSASLRVCAPEALLPEPFPSTKPRVPYVSNVAVHVDARGRGVASAMLDKCERASRMWGYDYVWLHVDVNNPRALAMYKKRGYITVTEDPWWYGIGGLLGQRRFLLKKRIKPEESIALPRAT